MTAAELNAHRVGQCLRAASVAIQDATRAIADLAVAIAPLVPRTFDTLAAEQLAELVVREIWSEWKTVPRDLHDERVQRIARVLEGGAR